MIFNHFYFGKSGMVLKDTELLTLSTLERCGQSWKNWFLPAFSLWQDSGVLERTNFYQFLLWEWIWSSWEHNLFLTVSALGGYGDPEKNLFWTVSTCGRVWWSVNEPNVIKVSTVGGCGGLERILIFKQFLLWEGCGQSWKNWFWPFATLQE